MKIVPLLGGVWLLCVSLLVEALEGGRGSSES
jgi:hypothetical protein